MRTAVAEAEMRYAECTASTQAGRERFHGHVGTTQRASPRTTRAGCSCKTSLVHCTRLTAMLKASLITSVSQSQLGLVYTSLPRYIIHHIHTHTHTHTHVHTGVHTTVHAAASLQLTPPQLRQCDADP